jgi:hypothetical protein
MSTQRLDALMRDLNSRSLVEEPIGAGDEGRGAHGHGGLLQKAAALRREQAGAARVRAKK